MDARMMEELLKKAKKMQEENPEEFSKKVEEVKGHFGKEEWQDQVDNLDQDKKERLQEMLDEAQNIKNSSSEEEKKKLIQEMKSKLSKEEQKKLEKASKLLKGMMKKK